MKKRFSIIAIVLTICNGVNHLIAQNTYYQKHITHKTVGFTPRNKNRVINGLAVGLSVHPFTVWSEEDTSLIKVNGLNLEVSPLGIIGGIWGTAYGFFGNMDSAGNKQSFFTKYGYQDSIKLAYQKSLAKVNGVSISLGGLTETTNKGLIINGLSGTSYTTSGVQISGLLNIQYQFKGLMIAGISNKTTKGKGVQIGLINNCKTGQLLQLGLFNRIGNRVLPFINWRFKKDKQAVVEN